MGFFKKFWCDLRNELLVGFFGLEKLNWWQELWRKNLWVDIVFDDHYFVVVSALKPFIISNIYIEANQCNKRYPTTVRGYPKAFGEQGALTKYNAGWFEGDLANQLVRDNVKKPFKVRAVVVTQQGKHIKSDWYEWPPRIYVT